MTESRPSPAPVTRKGADTRERILDAAQALVLARGFAGTALDDILDGTGLTKGAFFHHFRSKGELGRALVERWAENDFAMFEGFACAARERSDDPLEAALVFLRLFEEWLESLSEPFPGCMFASYVYESQQFEADIQDYVSTALRRWSQFFEDRFAAILEVRTPAIPVTARELAEAIVCILEGAFVLSRSHRDPELILRQSRLFRSQLQLIFGAAPLRPSA